MITIVPFLYRVNDVILNPLLILVFVLSLTYFFYGIARFISLEASDKGREEARNAILWGFVGMAIMFSVYGLIKFILGSFGIDPSVDISKDAADILKIK